jgi:hypothetical protein
VEEWCVGQAETAISADGVRLGSISVGASTLEGGGSMNGRIFLCPCPETLQDPDRSHY